MTGHFPVAAAWRPPTLLVLALAGGAVPTSSTSSTAAPASDEEVARLAEEARLADEAADNERSMMVGGCVVVLLVVLFCTWLAVVSIYGYLYGFRPCSSAQKACKEGRAPAATDAVTSPPIFTSPTKPGVAESGDIFVAALPAEESPCQLESELWKAPKDGEPPEEISHSWVAMAPLQTCTLAEPCSRIPATVALEPSAIEGATTGLATVLSATDARHPIGVTGRPPGCTMEEAEACDQRSEDRDQTSIHAVGKATLPVERPRSPPPTSLCWNSCISLVCCSVASSTTRAP